MELALEEVTQGVIFNNRGAIIVNLPDPVRYAVHKLLVYGERSGAYATKSRKDLTQAAALISYFRDAGQMDELDETVRDVSKRGPGWRKRLVEGLEALKVKMPDLSDAAMQLLLHAKIK